MAIIKKNIIYDQKYQLGTDIYYPNDTDSNTKILIFWHGGGWFRGNKESFKAIGINLANAGFMTFIPDYRLAPEYPFPAAHQDAVTFTEWLLQSEYTDEDDQENIVQIGASSGGTLALYVAGKYGFATVTWSAPVEFDHWVQNHQQVKGSKDPANELQLTNPDDQHQSFYKYFVTTYAPTKEALTKLDVKNYDLTHLNKLMMINSADELTPLDSVLSFIKYLAKNNHEVEFLLIKGSGHAMDYANEYLDESLDFLYQTIKRQDND